MNNNLKKLRKSMGYTQIKVQMETGIEQSLLSKFENGERIPPTDSLIRLADFYNVSIDYIAGIKDEEAILTPSIKEELEAINKRLDKIVKII